MSAKDLGEGSDPVGVEMRQMLQSIVKEALQDAIESLKRELQSTSSKQMEEVTSSLSRLEDQMRGVRGRLSDLDSRQRTGQLVGRFLPPPYVSGTAFTGAQFGERDKDRAPISPYSQ
jgi:hypothetical protein